MEKLLKTLPVVIVVCVALTSVFALTIPTYDSTQTIGTSSVVMDISSSTDEIFGAMRKISTVAIIITVILVVANWKIYSKAGEAGWACLIPIYANVVQFKIVGLNPWLLLLYLVPIVNLVAAVVFVIVVPFRLAKSFGKDLGWGFGLWLLPFIFNLMLAFGSSEYVGPNGEVKF